MPNPRFTLCYAACATMISGSAMADVSAATLETAADLNVYVMQAAASVCMIDAGVAKDSEIEALAATRVAFIEAAEALSANNIPGGTERLMQAWWPVDGAISMILAGDSPESYAATIADERASLRFAALSVLDKTAHQYQQTADLPMADVLTFDLAERQSVLVHEMKLMACELTRSPSRDAAIALKDTINVFEASMAALQNGVPEMGLVPSADYAVNQALAATSFDWDAVRASLTTIADYRTATLEDLETLRWKTDALDGRMSAVVASYLAPNEAIDVPQVAQLENDDS